MGDLVILFNFDLWFVSLSINFRLRLSFGAQLGTVRLGSFAYQHYFNMITFGEGLGEFILVFNS